MACDGTENADVANMISLGESGDFSSMGSQFFEIDHDLNYS